MLDIETIFCRYRDDVYRLALSYTRSTQEAEDVCQNVFVKLMEQTSIQPGKEKAWLMQVTANQCRNLLRSSWWRTTTELDESIVFETPGQSEIYLAVMGLKPKYRVVVYLRYYEQYTTQEIAELLKVKQSAVTTRLSRAREMLKKELEVSV